MMTKSSFLNPDYDFRLPWKTFKEYESTNKNTFFWIRNRYAWLENMKASQKETPLNINNT